jgi:DNA primase
MTMDKLSGRKTLKVGNILDEFEKDRIKERVDIVALFSTFGVALESKGTRYMGRCPWHEDGTPSLSVDREKGLYNCFGCGESGDAFTLVEKMQGVDFKAALEYLKSYSGHVVPVLSTPQTPDVRSTSGVPNEAPVENSEEAEIESLYFDGEENLLNPAAGWYADALRLEKSAQTYLAKRG